jgi:hypothetical protein
MINQKHDRMRALAKKIRDTITIGFIAGTLATLVMTTYYWLLRLLGFKFITTWETAAHIFLNGNLLKTPIGILTGFLAQFVLGALFGIIVAYTLRFTGKDYYLLKGVGVGAVIWLGSVGFFMRFLHIALHGRGQPLTNLLTIIDFIVIGIISSTIIARYGKFKV